MKENGPYTEMLSRHAQPEDGSLDCLDPASLTCYTHMHVGPKLSGENVSVPLSLGGLVHILADLGIQNGGQFLHVLQGLQGLTDAAEVKQRYGSVVTRNHRYQIALICLNLRVPAHADPPQPAVESGRDPTALPAYWSVGMCHVDVTLVEANVKWHSCRRSGSAGDWQPDL